MTVNSTFYEASACSVFVDYAKRVLSLFHFYETLELQEAKYLKEFVMHMTPLCYWE